MQTMSFQKSQKAPVADKLTANMLANWEHVYFYFHSTWTVGTFHTFSLVFITSFYLVIKVK